MSSVIQARTKKAARRHRLFAAIQDSDLALIVAFCAIGLLLSINVMIRVPDFAAMFGQFN
jgi:hypothetical protein